MLTNQNNRMFVASLHLAGALAVGLLLGGFYALVYQPLQRIQVEHLSRHEQLERLLIKTGTEGNEYRRLRDQLEEMSKSVAELNYQLAAYTSETAVIEDLSKIAASVDVEILDYQVGLTSSMPTHSQTEVEFHCQGSYASVCRFLEQAEQLTKTTKLSKFDLQARGNSDEYPIQLTFVLYSAGKSHDTKEKREVL